MWLGSFYAYFALLASLYQDPSFDPLSSWVRWLGSREGSYMLGLKHGSRLSLVKATNIEATSRNDWRITNWTVDLWPSYNQNVSGMNIEAYIYLKKIKFLGWHNFVEW